VDGKPFGEENARMLDLALDTARKYGFETRNIDYYAGDITMGSGEQTMGMLAHLDVVPAGEGWNYPPFGGEIANGNIYGRGTLDDKGPALCALYAMRAVRDCGLELKDGVRLILGCDEETGMEDVEYYLKNYKAPAFCFSPDSDFPVCNGEKGIYQGHRKRSRADTEELFPRRRPRKRPHRALEELCKSSLHQLAQLLCVSGNAVRYRGNKIIFAKIEFF
jgi:predicted dipeptidase